MWTIVPLGNSCAVTHTTQHLQIKKETGLFEWFVSRRLQMITNVINKIKVKIDPKIIYGRPNKSEKIVCINCHGITSTHFRTKTFKPIFRRRAARFLKTIRESKQIIFVRLKEPAHSGAPATLSEFKNFYASILSINPSLKIKFLLIDIVDSKKQFRKISNAYVTTHAYIEHNSQRAHWMNCPKQMDRVLPLLINLGYKVAKSKRKFHDHSVD